MATRNQQECFGEVTRLSNRNGNQQPICKTSETQTKNFNDELVTFKNELKDRDMDFNDKLEVIDNVMKERNRELEAQIVINEQTRGPMVL